MRSSARGDSALRIIPIAVVSILRGLPDASFELITLKLPPVRPTIIHNDYLYKGITSLHAGCMLKI